MSQRLFGKEGCRMIFLSGWTIPAVVLLSGCSSIPATHQQAGAGCVFSLSSFGGEGRGEEAVYSGLACTEVKSCPTSNIATNDPARLHRFSTRQKLNPVWWFQNADEPTAPSWYRPGQRCRNVMWHLRNSCHNFTSYVIGVGDKPFIRTGKFPKNNASPNGGWNWAVCRYKTLRLPFVDYKRGRFEFYCGWRNRGNFGMKINFLQDQKTASTKPPENATRTKNK